MNYEEKIKELTTRIEKLEKAENKRILKRKIQLSLKISKIIIILLIILTLYIKLIKPYKTRIDSIEQKVNSVETFVQEKWKTLQKYNPFTS